MAVVVPRSFRLLDELPGFKVECLPVYPQTLPTNSRLYNPLNSRLLDAWQGLLGELSRCML